MTTTKCRSKNPRQCPYHGAPLVISEFQALVNSGKMPTQEQLQEYMQANTKVQEAERKTSTLKMGASQISRLSPSEIKTLVRSIDNEEDTSDFIDNLPNAYSGNNRNTSKQALAILSERDDLSKEDTHKMLSRLYKTDWHEVADSPSSNLLNQIAENDPDSETIAKLVSNKHLDSKHRAKYLDERPGFVLEHINSHGYDEAADKYAEEFLKKPENGDERSKPSIPWYRIRVSS